jgi:endonuclease/exonuclease/phosphatase family metal-dependent hydrolase
MTYNIGGLKEARYRLKDVIEVIRSIQPDILAVQEITETVDLDGNWQRVMETIADALGYGHNCYFGPTISMREHFTAKKALFVDGLFNDWQDWWSGNAIYSRWPFVRLGDRSKPGLPQNLPVYIPLQYQGNRDTDPRFVILARIGDGRSFPIVMATHFSTLLGERDPVDPQRSQKKERAETMRWEQCQHMLDLTKRHLLERGELVILMGDLNATPSEACITDLLEKEGGFVRLAPIRSIPTHLKVLEPVDHILVYPGKRRIEYGCWVIDDAFTRKASDHLPVVAGINIYDENSARFRELGPGCINLEEA